MAPDLTVRDRRDKFYELRRSFPSIRFESYGTSVSAGRCLITFLFKVNDQIQFRPKIEIPWPEDRAPEELRSLIVHLGIVELISYWKATCSPRIEIKVGTLKIEQLEFWHSLLTRGLGEFFYLNGLTSEVNSSLFEFVTSGAELPVLPSKPASGELIMVSGGKDSSVMLAVLKDMPDAKRMIFTLGEAASTQETVRASGVGPLYSAKRRIDPLLLDLNSRGFLNGHTPFSAYISALGVLVARAHGLKHVIVANERSANESTAPVLNGVEVNHQYSKSLDFERRFRSYLNEFVDSSTQYFSLLRPLYDLQVSAGFSRCTEQLKLFRSCNVGQKQNLWCGYCGKCAFVYLSLAPFLTQSELNSIFGSDLFENSQIIEEIQALVGLSSTKPFECVGTVRESQIALVLALRRRQEQNASIPAKLQSLYDALPQSQESSANLKHFFEEWGQEHFLPPEYEGVLKKWIEN